MGLVAFVVNRTLLHDPLVFVRRGQAAARDRGWEPWFAPTGDAKDGRAVAREAVARGARLVFAAGGDGTVRMGQDSRGQDGQLEHFTARHVRISADSELPRQVDGEIVTPGRTLEVSVCPGALIVRQPW